ncbi:alpha/beta hydrolase fold domain-containing protein [Psychromicrobium silvestre]
MAELLLVLSFFGGAFGKVVLTPPEHPWLAAAEQGYAALDWVHRNAEQLGARADRIVVAGASSGGGGGKFGCRYHPDQPRSSQDPLPRRSWRCHHPTYPEGIWTLACWPNLA